MPRREGAIHANSLRMQHGANPGQSFLVVEGADDARFIQGHVDGACLVSTLSGKPNVVECINDLWSAGIRFALGVVDADFDRVLGRQVRPVIECGIVVSDFHDLDVFCFENGAQKVLREHVSNLALQVFFEREGVDAIQRIWTIATRIGEFKAASMAMQWGVSFKNLDLERCVDVRTLRFNEERFLAEVFRTQATPPRALPVENEFIAEANKIASLQARPAQICNGHDLVGLLLIAIQETLNQAPYPDLGLESLAAFLRVACDEDKINGSALFAEIRNAEKENPACNFLRPRPPHQGQLFSP